MLPFAGHHGRGDHLIGQTGDAPAFRAIGEVVGHELESAGDDRELRLFRRPDQRGGETPTELGAGDAPADLAGGGVDGQQVGVDVLIEELEDEVTGDDG